MAKINFNLSNASDDFRKGFFAAMDFMDGVPQGERNCISLDHASDNLNSVGIDFDDGGNNDNRTYKLLRGKLKFHSTGVER